MNPEDMPKSSPAAGGDEIVTLSKEEYEKITTEFAKAKQDVANVVDEIKNLRKENRELKDHHASGNPEDIKKAIEAAFAQREVDSAKAVYETASADFLSENPEFSTENDPGGVKLAAFQKELARMNLTGIKSKEGFMEAFTDALRLMSIKTGTNFKNVAMHEQRPGSSPAKSSEASVLSPIEDKFVKEKFNGDVQAYLKMKAKRPYYFEELLKWYK